MSFSIVMWLNQSCKYTAPQLSEFQHCQTTFRFSAVEIPAGVHRSLRLTTLFSAALPLITPTVVPENEKTPTQLSPASSPTNLQSNGDSAFGCLLSIWVFQQREWIQDVEEGNDWWGQRETLGIEEAQIKESSERRSGGTIFLRLLYPGFDVVKVWKLSALLFFSKTLFPHTHVRTHTNTHTL